MRNHTVKMFLISGAAAAALALGATSALAAGTATWTVTPGGGNVSANTRQIVFTDTSTSFRIICVGHPYALQLIVNLGHGSGLPSVIGEVTNNHSPADHCAAVGGRRFSLSADTRTPWPIQARTYNPTSGVTKGQIGRVAFSFPAASGSSCSVDIDGTAVGAHDGTVSFAHPNSAPTRLVIPGHRDLHIVSATTGCDGLFNNGDPVNLYAVFNLSTGQTITSP